MMIQTYSDQPLGRWSKPPMLRPGVFHQTPPVTGMFNMMFDEKHPPNHVAI
jgi:hypothetical protein